MSLKGEVKQLLHEFQSVSSGAIELTFLEKFLRPGDALFVNPQTGFVTSRRKMSAQEVAEYWSSVIFPDTSEESYSATYPFARARLVYVIETVIRTLKLNVDSKIRWCDFATGEGVMLQLIKSLYPRIDAIGTEHSPTLVSALEEMGLNVKRSALGLGELKYDDTECDISTLTWTLANAIDPVSVLRDVVTSTKLGGFICVAESSRIMVPMKKSLHDYLSKVDPSDSHPSHFSANTLRCLMEMVGLEITYINRFFDSDILLVIGKKVLKPRIRGFRDSQSQVVDFMKNWAEKTEYYETLRNYKTPIVN